MNEDGAPFDSGFDDTGPFRVSPESGGVSLESALRDFGPAAIDDLIPRLRSLAASLDAAHRAGVVHGALHPSKVFVTDEATELVQGRGAHPPYAAPEVVEGHGATPMSDQYGLAAIAYEWLLGRAITHNGSRPLEVRSMPGVDRSALSKAFTRALAPNPADRFTSCMAFCDALQGAIVPELPLADVDDYTAEDEAGPLVASTSAPIVPAMNVDDVNIPAEPFDSDREDAVLAQGKEQRALDPPLNERTAIAVPASTSSAATPPPARKMEVPRFGPVALFIGVLVGAIFGFAAGYMARPRALQSGAPGEIVVAPRAGEAGQARDADEALLVRQNDEAIDQLHAMIFRDLVSQMDAEKSRVIGFVHVLFCAKNIERIGDHAAHIAEAAYLRATGKRPDAERRRLDDSSSVTGHAVATEHVPPPSSEC